MTDPSTIIEVFADACCPFTHVGLRTVVAHRESAGRTDVVLLVRAWPLELVNGRPLDPAAIAEEVDELRDQVSPDLFAGFDPTVFPGSSIPAMALAAAGYDRDLATGEAVSLAVRDACFEQGLDIASPDVLAPIARRHELVASTDSIDALLDRYRRSVLADHEYGKAHGVIGSPFFRTPSGDHFCPALHIEKRDGRFAIRRDQAGFEAFLADCFGPPAE